MALINCPECGKEISDKAPACPHCGIPVAAAKPSMKDFFERNFWRIFTLIIVPLIVIWSIIGLVAIFFLTSAR